MAGSSDRAPHVLSVFRDFQANPPVRPLRGDKIGGVAAAIGERYGIDPVLVRVGFVLTTIYGGAGVLLYLLGWLLFPKEGNEGRGTSGVAAIILVALMIPALLVTTSVSGLLSLAGGLGAIYLLHHYRGDGSGTVPAATETPNVTTGSTSVTEGDGDPREQRPAWDPLGAAPFAWDLPDPSPEPTPEPVRPNRRWITVVTTVLALTAGTVTIVAGVPIAEGLAIALSVLGVGMVIGSFLHGGRGLIGVAIPVGAAAMLMSVLPVQGPWQGIGEIEAAPATVDALEDRYALSAGEIELDLTQLPSDKPVRTSTALDMGSTVVRVPRDADIVANCRAEYGRVDCMEGESAQDGRSAQQHVDDPGPDGRGGGRIELDLFVGSGNVEVIRG